MMTAAAARRKTSRRRGTARGRAFMTRATRPLGGSSTGWVRSRASTLTWSRQSSQASRCSRISSQLFIIEPLLQERLHVRFQLLNENLAGAEEPCLDRARRYLERRRDLIDAQVLEVLQRHATLVFGREFLDRLAEPCVRLGRSAVSHEKLGKFDGRPPLLLPVQD